MENSESGSEMEEQKNESLEEFTKWKRILE